MIKVLVVGDVMVDRYLFVQNTRRAQEADVPVYDVVEKRDVLGGAGNVANNLRELLPAGSLVCMVGIANLKDSRCLSMIPSIYPETVDCPTMIKERICQLSPAGAKIISRIDHLTRFPEVDFSILNQKLDYWLSMHWDAVVFSDYDKGTIPSAEFVQRFSKIPLRIVDSKRKDLSIFRGLDVLKINEGEYSAQVSLQNSLYNSLPVSSMFNYCVVTRGKDPTILQQFDQARAERIAADPKNHYSFVTPGKIYVTHEEQFPVETRHQVDVTGCGDTHTAALCVSLLENRDIRSAIRFANRCAGLVVEKFGTSTVNRKELEDGED